MAETLYDENRGGPEGNTHIAIGSAFNEAFRGDVRTLTEKQLEELWFNQSAEHTDIISTKQIDDGKIVVRLEYCVVNGKPLGKYADLTIKYDKEYGQHRVISFINEK